MSEFRDIAVANARAEWDTQCPCVAIIPDGADLALVTCDRPRGHDDAHHAAGAEIPASEWQHEAAITTMSEELARANGRHDTQRRRRAKRSGRETGCWTYIPEEDLERAGFEPGGELPYYRTFSTHKRSVIVNLYREQ